jgi:16S rRNA (guanine(1405)-N(7))-methyltransferase
MKKDNRADPEAITRAILGSRKYRDVSPGTVMRIATDCARKYGRKDAEKRARAILHAAWGAYFGPRIDYAAMLARLSEDIHAGLDSKECVRPVLEAAPSAKERLPILDRFYRDIFAVTGTPGTVVEHACGLNPLAMFWAPVSEECEWRVYDIDLRLVGFLNSAANLLGLEGRLKAAAGDALSGNYGYADVVLMLKLLPVLERQRKGAALDAMRRAECRHLVVSFPVASLSGRAKGMPENYTELFGSWVRNEPWKHARLLFETELVFVVEKG